MKTVTLIIIVLIVLVVLGLSFWGGMGCERTRQPEPLASEYIQSCGFRPIQGGGLVKEFLEILPDDTIRSVAALIPQQIKGEQVFIMGYVFNNRFMPVDVFYNRKDFDNWISLMPEE